MWEYFASLYKNSNKGIKGRGKDRRISAAPYTSSASSSTYHGAAMTSVHKGFSGTYHHDGSDRGSRGSSMSSDGPQKVEGGYDFNAPLHTAYQQPHGTGYDDMVFPERRVYS
jgi:hypothetical protein